MSNDMDVDSKRKDSGGNGRNPLFIIGGFVVLGLALTLIIFGGNLFGGTNEPAAADEVGSILEQVPAFEAAEVITNNLPTGGGPLEVGSLAYDFVLNDVEGNEVRLSNFAGQPVIINFWATWCAPCRIEMPELEAAFHAYQDDNLVILALDQQESAADVSDFFQELGLSFTAVLDDEGTVSELYGVANILPTTFFINGAGEVTAIHRGPMVQSQIDGYLADTIPTAAN
ncbi:redoxin domain-containing protein [Candidatus Leptofilum sp.]|uniref:redoxin domain-containing protein n=1 Tax=Candidatus Leptofilum sp. TaxID=3241576 RepID=UPI003B5A05C5